MATSSTNSQLTAGIRCWYSPEVKGHPPSGRMMHSADVVGNKVYVFGGWAEEGSWPQRLPCRVNDLHVLDLDKMEWKQLHLWGAPCKRYGHATAVAGSRLFVHGGSKCLRTILDDLHVLDTQAQRWKKLKPSGSRPSLRKFHTLNEVGNKLYLFGGYGSSGCVNTMYVLDLFTLSWTQPATRGTSPEARHGHTMTPVDSSLILFGGLGDYDRYFSDVHVFNTATLSWTQPKESNNLLPCLHRHSATLVGDRVFIFGGEDKRQHSTDNFYVLEKSGSSVNWFKLQNLAGAPCPRHGHSSFAVGSSILAIFGGTGKSMFSNDLHFLDVDKAVRKSAILRYLAS